MNMMMRVLALALLCAAVMAFQPSCFAGTSSVVSQRAAVRSSRGVLHMAKHAQAKGAKKHQKNRPKKSNPSDRNHKPAEYSLEIMSNGRDYPGKPPVYEIVEEAA
ncbi:hypothetical protein JKP88DRAFT_224330 [Tribonema minus]|uniref:Uncharacterized protein n=1 Tax=Tribonema minus TaxID=303371 RepID=A0A836CBS4_9STRA|nr:hypothetical protein JKP88DRAFT_224330 [Tribonema minus]